MLFGFWVAFVNTLLLITGIFLILLVLIQRGRGGGLIGALGGAGGSSPFGSRAGDMFTRITLIVALVWILLAVTQIWLIPKPADTNEPGITANQ